MPGLPHSGNQNILPVLILYRQPRLFCAVLFFLKCFNNTLMLLAFFIIINSNQKNFPSIAFQRFCILSLLNLPLLPIRCFLLHFQIHLQFPDSESVFPVHQHYMPDSPDAQAGTAHHPCFETMSYHFETFLG